MAKVGIITGVLLIILALGGYFAGGMASFTALIPAVAGVPILIGSLIALKPEKVMLGMHIAALFGVLGFIAPLGRLIPVTIKGNFELSLATVSMIGMAVICGIFTILCIKSFIDARRAKG